MVQPGSIMSKENSQHFAEPGSKLAPMDLDPDFAHLLKDKRVIIVGPAETLRGAGQGKIIDANDLVVRFNTAIQYMPFSDDLAHDIGTRTDIVYCNSEILLDGILRQGMISYDSFRGVCERVGIKYLVGANNDFILSGGDKPEPNRHSEYLAFKLFLAHLSVAVGFRMLYSTCTVARNLLDGHIGRTGFLAILDLLAYDIRQLSITGMTFYHKGGHLFFENCAELDPMKSHLGQAPPEHVKGHNSYLELEVLKQLARVYGPKLKFDQHLEGLMTGRDTTR
jgi:Glycosyltransferase family 29 (sialyltransferase)